MKIDPLALLRKIPSEKIQLQILDRVLNWRIPFNSGLGIRLKELSPKTCIIETSPRRRQKNHVNGAHACFLALMAEYPAGLLLAQHFGIDRYRLIISELKMSYSKQGRGALIAYSKLEQDVPAAIQEEHFVKMVTEIRNSANEPVARGETVWQIKPWDKVRGHS